MFDTHTHTCDEKSYKATEEYNFHGRNMTYLLNANIHQGKKKRGHHHMHHAFTYSY
jgi:hypothetical protein